MNCWLLMNLHFKNDFWVQSKLFLGLAQEENAMGRFLKENGKYDKTKAGKVMTAAGKALSFSAQQK